MASSVDIFLRRNKTCVAHGVAKLREGDVVTPINLDDKTVILTARDRKGGDVVLLKQTGDGITHDPDQAENTGAYTLRIEADETDDEEVWPVDETRNYPHEIVVDDGDDDVIDIGVGTVKYSPDVS